MSNKFRRFVLAGLSLILIGGVLTPTVAQAATTDSSDSSTNKETTTSFTSIDSPYHLVTKADGSTIKQILYPTAPSQSYTADEVLTEGFADNFLANVTPTPNSALITAAQMINLAKNDPAVDPNESLNQYLYLLNKKSLEEIPDAATFSQLYVVTAYLYTWLIKVAAQQKLGTIDYKTANKQYTSSVRPALVKTEADANEKAESEDTIDFGLVTYADPFFQSEEDFKNKIPNNLGLASTFLLDGYSDEELANLNPAATEAANAKVIAQPLSNFILKKDNQVVADSILSAPTGAGPLAFVFGDQSTTPSVTSKPVTVHYVDEQGKALKPDKTLTGSLGEAYKAEPLSITGYKLVKTTGDESGKFTSTDQSVTYTYRKVVADVIVKNSVVYGMKRLSLYSSPTFTAKARKTTHAKKSRMNRPMFKILGSATSKNGARRYKVQALNGKKITGYITAKAGYTAPLYYANRQSKVTVINPGGLNGYAKSNLSGRKTHYKQGQVLKVKKIVSHNLTTRFQLSNGKYISANKKLVMAGKVSMPTSVRAKTGINRYGTTNLTKKNRHIAKGTTLKITGWAYSNAHNFRKGDTLRYKIAGGYVTANSRLVDTIR